MNAMNRILLLLGTLGLLVSSCKSDELTLSTLDFTLETVLNAAASKEGSNYTHYIMPQSNDYHLFEQDWEHNPITKEKVELGKFLFFETGLALDALKTSGEETYSCGSCHIPSRGFTPGRAQGIADGGIGFVNNGLSDRSPRLEDPDNPNDDDSRYREDELDVQGARPLSMLNSMYVTNSTWAGAFGAGGVNEGTEDKWGGLTEVNHLGMAGLESQNIEGLHLHRMRTDKETFERLGYIELFDKAFPNIEETERYGELTTSFALSAYLRSLLPNEAPFQRWLKGEKTAMTEQEKEGAILFFRKAGCVNCHKTGGLNAMEFYAVGVNDLHESEGQVHNVDPNDPRHLGRGGFTDKDEDKYKFKVPQLYNLKDAKFYFHGSSKQSLREVVEYFNAGIPENNRVPAEQISPFFRPLNLEDDEIDALTAFLETGLYDADLDRYMPESIPSGFCFPNNDMLSRHQMGCGE